MSSQAQPMASPDLGGAIARSRSRYKGNRPSRPLIDRRQPTRVPAEQSDTNGRAPANDQSKSQEISEQDPERTYPHTRRPEYQPESRGTRYRNTGARARTREETQTSPWVADDGHGLSKKHFGLAREEKSSEAAAGRLEATSKPEAYSRPPPAPPHLEQSEPTNLRRKYPHGEETSHTASTGLRGKSGQAKPQDMESELAKTPTLHKKRPSRSRDELKKAISAPLPVEPPEITVKPAFDAPVSAVNAGERRVIVKYGETKIALPVTPSTNTVDIIRDVWSQWSENLDSTKHLVLESFKQLGLERPLRRYENIREVMNSWGDDFQNHLVVVPSPTSGRDDALELQSVPRSQPGETSVYIYHSQKPGSWEKRWVTLRSDGQVMIAKKDGRDATNICHISDFDIYNVAARHLKKVKPPKKICFAVKSQQKSSMFLTTENFVHFFSTSDKEVATSWYRAVQGWRSWYLVYAMGKGKEESPPKPVTSSDNLLAAPSQPTQSHADDQGPEAALRNLEKRSSALKRLPTRNRGPPPVSFPKKLMKDQTTGHAVAHDNGPSIIQGPSPAELGQEPFAQTGLLGRTYTQRRKAQQDRDLTNKEEQGFNPVRPVSNGHDHQPSGLQRNPSQRTKPKPLVDISTLQHTRSVKGRGVRTSNVPAGGLVSAATNAAPEPSASFDPNNSLYRRPTTARRPNNSSNPYNNDDDDQPFTGGLLAGTPSSALQCHATMGGRGVKTGKRDAKEPMLTDVLGDGGYQPGSLLDQVRRQSRVEDGDNGLVIDREKRREVDVPAGEGL